MPATSISRNSRKKRHPQGSGFTLVEVMIASLIMIMAITGSISLLQYSFRIMDNARNCNLAAQIMQSEIERLRMKSWSTIPDSGTVDVSAVFNNDPQLASRFSVTRTVAGVTGRETSMKEINLVVTWTGLDGMQHIRSFRTFYSKDGLYDFYYTVAKS